jgi:predicted PurR-regulated permease PerM
MISEKPIDFDRFVRWIITGGVLLVIFFALTKLSGVLLPFLLAWLTAYILDPLVLLIQRLIKKRALAVFSLYFLILLIGAIFTLLLIPVIVEEFRNLSSLIDMQLNAMQWPAWIPKDIVVKAQGYLSSVDYKSILNQDGVTEKLFGVAKGIWIAVSGVYGIVGAIFGIVTYLLYLVFLMLDFQSLSEGWKGYIPEKHKSFVLQLAMDLEEQMNGYFRAQTKVVISVAILFAIGFKIIGLPFAIMLGILVGLLNYIPYMQLIGIIPALGLAAINSLDNGSSIWLSMSLVATVFAVIQLIQEVFLTSRFMGGFSGLHPAIILLSLSIWGALLGMIGLIIAIPITAIILSYYRRIILSPS